MTSAPAARSMAPGVPPLAWATVQHGFTRGPSAMAGVSRLLAGAGIASVRPKVAGLRPASSFHDVDYLRAGAAERQRTAEQRGWGDVPWLGVGHSAGAAAVLVEAACRRGAGWPVAGVVCLDGTDTVGRLGAVAAADLGDVPIRYLGAPPSRCNAHGSLIGVLMDACPLLRVEIIPNAGHGDAELLDLVEPEVEPPPEPWSDGPGPRLRSLPLYRAACGDRSGAEQVAALRTALLNAAAELLMRLR